jgi:diacylglycerol kinase (ATP)
VSQANPTSEYSPSSARTRTALRQPAVIYNPIKVVLPKLRDSVREAAEAAGWGKPIWFATKEDEPGQRAAASALRRGADLVLVAGGDGTVRAVAEALRGSGVPMAILPSGTGNLLARNLNLPLNSVDDALAVAFDGVTHNIDLGVAVIVRPDHSREEHVFAVVAGLGIDAKMIANTSTTLKKAVGWLAYIDGTIRSIPTLEPVSLRYSRDGGPARHVNVHTIMIGNCGQLPGGILLIPEAKPDDGILDIVALRPHGAFGWIRVWNKLTWENGVLRKSAVGRKIIDLSKDAKDVAYWRARSLQLWVDSPQEFQLDGDEFGEAVQVIARVDAGSLAVQMPRPS